MTTLNSRHDNHTFAWRLISAYRNVPPRVLRRAFLARVPHYKEVNNRRGIKVLASGEYVPYLQRNIV